jgi:class 3 adenylate cyclase
VEGGQLATPSDVLQVRLKLSPRLIGRRTALESLSEAVDRAIAGDPSVVLVSGEAGVGKTRLVREVAAVAEERGAQVCMTRCIEGSLVPYLPFASGLLPRLERAGLVDSAGLAGLRPGLVPPDQAAAESRTPDIFFQLPRATFELATRRPLVLVIDDVHWADSGTLALLEHLVLASSDESGQREIPLCTVVVHRPVAPGGAVGKVIGRLRREHIVQVLSLTGMDELELNDLLWEALDGPCAPPLLTAVHRTTGGNPLFALELLKLLAAEGKLRREGGYITSEADPEDLPFQNEVTSALEERAAGLSRECADLLTFAALTGDEAAFDLLQRITGLPVETVIEQAEHGITAGFLFDIDEGVRFTHPLVRRVFARRWSAARRRRAHVRIVQALERTSGEDPGTHDITIAEHLLAAGSAAEGFTRGHAAARAGEHAFSISAWGAAARYYSAALDNAAYAGSLPAIERARLAYRTAMARYRNLDVIGSRESFARAVELFKEQGDLLGWADALVGWTRSHISHELYGGPRVLESPEVREFFAAVGEDHPIARARMETQIAEVLFTAQRPEARDYAERALAVGRDTADAMLTMHASDTLGITSWLNLSPAEALEYHQQALDLAREIGDPWYEAWPLQRMPLALAALGRLKEAESVAQQASVLAGRTHDWAEHSLTLGTMASLAFLRGDFDVAEQCAAGSALMYRRSNYAWSPGIAYPALIQARLARGDWDAAVHATTLWRNTGAGSPSWYASLLCKAHDGSIDVLLSEIEANQQRLARPHPPGMLSLGTLCMRAEIACLSGELQVAAPCNEALTQAVERGILFAVGLGVYLLPRVLGDLAAAAGDYEAAERWYADALVAARMSRARQELGRTAFGYASLLVRQGAADERAHAEALLAEARNLFAELGMVPWTRRAEDLAESAGITLAPAEEPVSPAPAAIEDTEIIEQIADGLTRREMAARLLLSERAIGKRIADLRLRLGIDGEADARAHLQRLAARPRRLPAHSGAAQVGQAGLRILLVSDIVGSTQLNERLGDQHWVELLEQHNELVREQFGRFDGVEVKHTGDGIFGWFPTASSAIGCALAIASHFPLHHTVSGGRADVCIGMSAGEPVVVPAGDLVGLAVTQAFRICDRAGPGEVLVSDGVRQLVEGATFDFVDRGRLALKGFRERTRVHRVMTRTEQPQSAV